MKGKHMNDLLLFPYLFFFFLQLKEVFCVVLRGAGKSGYEDIWYPASLPIIKLLFHLLIF